MTDIYRNNNIHRNSRVVVLDPDKFMTIIGTGIVRTIYGDGTVDVLMHDGWRKADTIRSSRHLVFILEDRFDAAATHPGGTQRDLRDNPNTMHL